MIQFALKCDKDHQFESWFASSAAFEKLQNSHMITCAVCGSSNVQKAVMAPRVSTAKAKQTPLSAPANAAEQAMSELKRKIEANSDYVGNNFATEARAMHDGSAPERSIYGEAKPEEARKLIEDGIPVLPLPFMPGRKSN